MNTLDEVRLETIEACVRACEVEAAEWKAAGDQGEVGAIRQCIRALRKLAAHHQSNATDTKGTER